MRIGIFSDRYLPQVDGVSYAIEGHRRQMEALGHEVFIFAPKPSFRYKEKSKNVIRFAAIKGLFFEDWLTSVFFPPQAIATIDKVKLDLVHFQTPSQIGLLGAHYAIKRGLPLVTTYHTDLYEYVKHYPQMLPGVIALSLMAPIVVGGSRETYRAALASVAPHLSIEKWNQKVITSSITLLHNHCDLVITPSSKMTRQLESWHTKAPIATLPTGVDRLRTTPREVTAVRNKLKLAPSDQVVLLVCRIGTEKNIELLLQAFELVAKAVPDAKLVIVGPGDDLDHYTKIAQTLDARDRISFTGMVEHVRLGAYYSLAHVYAFPSLSDTQGLTVNEATASGLPVVMVDAEISEVVLDHENGLYARADPQDFASKIITILNNAALHERFSARSIELAAQYSEESQVIKLIQLYDGLRRHEAAPTAAHATSAD